MMMKLVVPQLITWMANNPLPLHPSPLEHSWGSMVAPGTQKNAISPGSNLHLFVSKYGHFWLQKRQDGDGHNCMSKALKWQFTVHGFAYSNHYIYPSIHSNTASDLRTGKHPTQCSGGDSKNLRRWLGLLPYASAAGWPHEASFLRLAGLSVTLLSLWLGGSLYCLCQM